MKQTILITFACLFAATTEMQAQNTIKFGSVDVNSIIWAMPEINAVQKKLEAKTKEYENELQRMQKDLQDKANAYDKQKATLDRKTAEEREQQLQDMYTRINEYNTQAQQNLQQMQENEVKPIHEKVLKAIETVGKKNGFVQIYDISANSNVVYYNPAFYTDVTSLVKKELGLKEPFSTTR
jgi:outer membrane protein